MFVNRRRALWFGVGVLWAAVLYFIVVRPVWSRSAVAECRECAAPKAYPEREGEEGFQKLGPPKPGEWRTAFKEPEQSFEKYVGGLVNRRCDHRTTFYLQPLGDASERYKAVLEKLRVHAEAYFGVPAKVLPPIPMVEEALHEQRLQYHATQITNVLADRLPKDALVYVGITEKDLYSTGLNFVFGEASLHHRCGIYSLARLQTPDAALFLRRALKLVSHESGHILSIEHCTAWSCCMQGGNSLAECDSQPLHLCPVDLRKVLWNTGIGRDDRYRRLQALYQEWGLDPEAHWVAHRLGIK